MEPPRRQNPLNPLRALARHLSPSPSPAPSANAAALPAAGGAVHPELQQRGVSQFSCFDIAKGATVDELMAQR